MSYRFSDQNDPADFESELIFNILITENSLYWNNRYDEWWAIEWMQVLIDWKTEFLHRF